MWSYGVTVGTTLAVKPKRDRKSYQQRIIGAANANCYAQRINRSSRLMDELYRGHHREIIVRLLFEQRR